MGAEKTKDEAGNKYSRLLVLRRGGSIKSKASWLCRCDCGTETVLTGDTLRQGKTKSCGCFRREHSATNSFKHGQSNGGGTRKESRTYRSWQEMWSRCTYLKSPSYKNYGAKGITVDRTWGDFSVFLLDMGSRPDGMTLDRIDNSKGYSKENCRWATRTEQNQNRSQCHRITLNNETHVLAEWCRRLNVPYSRAYKAIVLRRVEPNIFFSNATQHLAKMHASV